MNTYTKNSLKIINNLEEPENFTASSPAKISKKGNNAFSILAGPRFSCPGATKACVECYAMKGNHHLPVVQTALGKNYLLLKKMKSNRSVKSTNNTIQLLTNLIPRSAELFRIHESGDFFNNWYINVWAKVVCQRKDVEFWAYTRSFDLNFSKLVRQPNFLLWASTDFYNVREAERFVKRYGNSGVKHAYGPWHDTEIPENSVICPATNGKLNVVGACGKCRLCLPRLNSKRKERMTKNIVFMAH